MLDPVASPVVKLDPETEELALTIKRVKFFMKLRYRESQHETSVVKVNVVLNKKRSSKRKPSKTRFSIRKCKHDLFLRWSFHNSKSGNGCNDHTSVC